MSEDDTIPVTEYLDALTAEELRAASLETSRAYNGIVLGCAVRVAMRRLELTRFNQLDARLRLGKSILSRWCRSKPISSRRLHAALLQLVFAVER